MSRIELEIFGMPKEVSAHLPWDESPSWGNQDSEQRAFYNGCKRHDECLTCPFPDCLVSSRNVPNHQTKFIPGSRAWVEYLEKN
jgi:hypothetical protein